jgi:hypothetical protein
MSKLMNNPVETELNAIRIRHYEETKNMTPAERVEYVNAKTAPLMQQYNFRTATPVEFSHTAKGDTLAQY